MVLVCCWYCFGRCLFEFVILFGDLLVLLGLVDIVCLFVYAFDCLLECLLFNCLCVCGVFFRFKFWLSLVLWLLCWLYFCLVV